MSIARPTLFRVLSAAVLLSPFSAGCAAISPQEAYAQAPQDAQKQNIVVHLGSFTDDLHSAFMALSLATNLQKHGANVTLFLDREGVRLADVRERGDLTWGDSGGTATAMTEFVQAGGKVLLCPHCASLAGMEVADIRPGSRMATHEDVSAIFLDADKVIDF